MWGFTAEAGLSMKVCDFRLNLSIVDRPVNLGLN